MSHFADLSNYTQEENDFWNNFISLEGLAFHTCKHLEFSFEVRGNEIFIDRREKSLTRSTIIHAFRLCRQHQASGQAVTGPKQIGVFGASYLFPIFRQMGII